MAADVLALSIVIAMTGLKFLNQLKAAEGLKEDSENLKLFEKVSSESRTCLEIRDCRCNGKDDFKL